MEIHEVNSLETKISVMQACGRDNKTIFSELNRTKKLKLLVIANNDLFNGYAYIDPQNYTVDTLYILDFAKNFGVEHELAAHLEYLKQLKK